MRRRRIGEGAAPDCEVKTRLRHPLSRFRLAGVLLGVIIVYGITGYTVIDGWNLLDSFYMVIITISTVGYQEIHPQGVAGRIFTSTLIVVGVATMLYGFWGFSGTPPQNALRNYRKQ